MLPFSLTCSKAYDQRNNVVNDDSEYRIPHIGQLVKLQIAGWPVNIYRTVGYNQIAQPNDDRNDTTLAYDTIKIGTHLLTCS